MCGCSVEIVRCGGDLPVDIVVGVAFIVCNAYIYATEPDTVFFITLYSYIRLIHASNLHF